MVLVGVFVNVVNGFFNGEVRLLLVLLILVIGGILVMVEVFVGGIFVFL